MRNLSAVVGVVALLSLPVGAGAIENNAAHTMAWSVDAAHSEVNFKVTHFFTPVNGSFRDFQVNFAFDKDHPENSSVEARIAVASVSTGNERRDTHLRSDDWFEAEKYPYMTFKSTAVRKVAESEYVASGDLTIKGVTRQIELPIHVLGVQMIPEQMAPMMGGIKEAASFHATATIDRAEFGVGVGSWAGTMVVGGDVEIELVVEANHK